MIDPVITSFKDASDGNKNKIKITQSENAEIYYTLDGMEPSNASTRYSLPFAYPTPGVTIKAIAIKNEEKSKIVEFNCIKTIYSGHFPNRYNGFGTVLITEPIDFCNENATLVSTTIIGSGKICNSPKIYATNAFIYPFGLDYDKIFINCGDIASHFWKKGQVLSKNGRLLIFDGKKLNALLSISSGNFADKPIDADLGYIFFCLDKQTPEGKTNGIALFHKGNNVWVDALGRTVN